jgi:hypothetical protein
MLYTDFKALHLKKIKCVMISIPKPEKKLVISGIRTQDTTDQITPEIHTML